METSLEPERVDRVREWLQGRDWERATTDELARAAGLSRMTLYRRGLDKGALLAHLRARLEKEYGEALLPALVSSAPAAARLRLALDALCEVTERYLGLLDALGRARDEVFHERGEGPVMTRVSFTDGLRRILEDGVAEGTVSTTDAGELATLLFNATGWTYRHMRAGHRWASEHLRERLVALLLEGILR